MYGTNIGQDIALRWCLSLRLRREGLGSLPYGSLSKVTSPNLLLNDPSEVFGLTTTWCYLQTGNSLGLLRSYVFHMHSNLTVRSSWSLIFHYPHGLNRFRFIVVTYSPTFSSAITRVLFIASRRNSFFILIGLSLAYKSKGNYNVR